MIIFLTCPLRINVPMPNSSRPALLETRVRFLVPAALSASRRFSGSPQTPKPPMAIVEPSGMRETASAAVAMVLFNGGSSQSADIVNGRQAPERLDLHHEEND